MVKVVDRFLLFIYSLIVLVVSAIAVCIGFQIIPAKEVSYFLRDVYSETSYAVTTIVVGLVVMLISIRLFYISIRRGNTRSPSIDQRSEYGDIRISLETVENLSLKAAGRSRGARELRSRVHVSEAGLDIVMRAVVDGDQPIPTLTEEMQANVKQHVEEITGIPVAKVSVFIANIVQSQPTFKSRVE